MKNWYLLIVLLFLGNWTFPQNIKNVIGPSPEAAAFAKYGDIPVSNYTGIPNIAIPLYTVQNNDIKMPVSLSYYAGGFRVDEEAGRAGLGWIVNAGGIISRSVNGDDDFLPIRGYLNNSMPEFFDDQVTAILARRSNLVGSLNSDAYILDIFGRQVDMAEFLPVTGNPDGLTYDLEPDVFTYNFNGISGKFTIRKDKKIVKQNPDAIDIKLLNNDGTSWQITTTDGIKYIFDKAERCRFQSTVGIYSNYITAWYLTKIISPRGAEITLTYTDILSDIISYNNLNEKYVLEVVPLNSAATSNLTPTPGTRTFSYPAVKSYNPVMLTSINFPYGSMTFEYQDRIDLLGDKRLSKININNTINTEASFFYDLVQDYFNATFTSYTMPTSAGLDQNIFNKRLKLTSLVKRNMVGNVEQVHQFSYNEQDLPSKNSYARDDWGFYNGAHNSTLLPDKIYPSHMASGQTVSYPSGANRTASAEHCVAYILKEIKYPTGGKTVFNFEANDYDVSNSANGGPYASPPSQLVEITKRFITRRGFDDIFQITFPTSMTSSSVIFSFSSQSGQAPSSPYPRADDAYFEIYSANDLSIPVGRSLLGYESFWVNQGNYYYKRDDQFSLPAGDYVIKTHIASNVLFLNYIDFSCSFKYYEDRTSNQHQIVTGGGLRIAKVTNFDHSGNIVSTKNFNYHYNFDYNSDGIAEECSYGRRLASTSYTSFENVEMCGYDATGLPLIAASQSYNLYSQSSIPNSEVIVGYDKVTVWDGAGKTTGYTEYDYRNTVSIETSYVNSGVDSRPAGIPNLISLDNGSLLKQTDYVFTSNSFRKLKEVINEYSPTPVITQVGLRMVPTTISSCSWPFAPGHGLLFALYPASQSSWNRLSFQTINDYSDATNFTSIKTAYEYEGDLPKHYLPRITTTTNSAGKEISKVSIYPTDYANGNTAIDQMKVSNIIEPIEQVTYIKDGDNTRIVSGTVSLFKAGGKGLLDKQYSTENIMPVPLNAFKFSNQSIGNIPFTGSPGVINIDPAYNLKVSYDKYDDFGNLLSATPAEGTPVSYIYSYKNQYPIAEVKNSSYAAVETVINSLGIESLAISDPSEQSVRNIAASLRAGLPAALVTAYTYKPLVGMTSRIDAKGQMTYFEYDSFQRLWRVKDQRGKIVKEYRYQYKQ